MTYDYNATKKANFEITCNGKYILEIFPDEYLALNKELVEQRHPKLQAILAGYPADEIDVKIAQIAAYCEVMLDGDYDLAARRQLCDILLKRLIELREPEVVQNIIQLN